MINNFSLFKNQNKKNDNEPDYRISAKIGEEYQSIGAAWIKDSRDGSKYLSVSLQKPRGEFKGYQVVEYAESPIEPPTEANTSRHASFLNDVPTIPTPDF